MTRIKLTLSYMGSNFSGWQLQTNARTAQGEVEKALNALYSQPCRVTGCSRTDEGVHAAYYVAHYDAPTKILPSKIPLGLNRYLPQDIAVHSACEVDDNFDARRCAKNKTYIYRIYISPYRQPLKDDRYLQLYKMPNLDLMRNGASVLVGKHDFGGFASVGGGNKTSVRTLYDIDVTLKGNDIEIRVCGNGFLYNMVRNIAGALVWLGNGKITLSQLEDTLTQGKKTVYYKTLPSKGLMLMNVDY